MRPNQSLQPTAVHVYEVRPRKDRRGVDVIPEALAFGRLCMNKLRTQASRQSFMAGHMTVMLIGSKNMRGYEARHRAAAQMSSSTTLTVGCQCVRLQSIYKDPLQCPQRTRLENKL
jgi:hypothetical protein